MIWEGDRVIGKGGRFAEGFEAVGGPLHAFEGSGFEAAELIEGGVWVDIEALLGGLAVEGVEGFEGGGDLQFEAGDFSGGEFGGGVVGEVAEFGWGAEEVECEGVLGFGPLAFGFENGGEGEPAFEEPFAALLGAAELAEGDSGFAGEGCAEDFGVESAVVVPGDHGAALLVGAEGGFVVEAAVEADGVDDDLVEEPVLLGGFGRIGGAPGFEAEGDFGGVVGGEEA